MELPYRENASIIARKNGKYLLVRKPRKHHAWQFPQGGVEAGESLEAAAKREFMEEVGCDCVEIAKEVGVYQYDFPAEFQNNLRYEKFRGQKVHLFLAEFTGEENAIHVNEKEIVEARFVKPEELEELIESPEYLQIIQNILKTNG